MIISKHFSTRWTKNVCNNLTCFSIYFLQIANIFSPCTKTCQQFLHHNFPLITVEFWKVYKYLLVGYWHSHQNWLLIGLQLSYVIHNIFQIPVHERNWFIFYKFLSLDSTKFINSICFVLRPILVFSSSALRVWTHLLFNFIILFFDSVPLFLSLPLPSNSDISACKTRSWWFCPESSKFQSRKIVQRMTIPLIYFYVSSSSYFTSSHTLKCRLLNSPLKDNYSSICSCHWLPIPLEVFRSVWICTYSSKLTGLSTRTEGDGLVHSTRC